MKTIKLTDLKKLGACEEHASKFEQLFGATAEINEANILVALQGGLNFEWLFEKMPEVISLDVLENWPVSAKDSDGNTPLRWAACCGRDKVVELLKGKTK